LLFQQGDIAMADTPFASLDTASAEHYALSLKAYKDLCNVRDELRLFAAVATRRATRNPEMLVCRNTLAHCFEHLAQRVDVIVGQLNETSGEPIVVPLAGQTMSRH
jgi:hypothetical protein